MTIQEYKTKITASSFSEETKQKILAILDKPGVTIPELAQIQDLLQEEVESEFQELEKGLDTTELREALQGENKILDQELQNVEKELATDLAIANTAMEALSGQLDEVGILVQEDQVAALQNQLKQ